LHTSALYPLSLHDALPIYAARDDAAAAHTSDRRIDDPRDCSAVAPTDATGTDDGRASAGSFCCITVRAARATRATELIPGDLVRSEEHTSELQSLTNLVCR